MPKKQQQILSLFSPKSPPKNVGEHTQNSTKKCTKEASVSAEIASTSAPCLTLRNSLKFTKSTPNCDPPEKIQLTYTAKIHLNINERDQQISHETPPKRSTKLHPNDTQNHIIFDPKLAPKNPSKNSTKSATFLPQISPQNAPKTSPKSATRCPEINLKNASNNQPQNPIKTHQKPSKFARKQTKNIANNHHKTGSQQTNKGTETILSYLQGKTAIRSSKRLSDDFSAERPRKKPARVLRTQLDSDEEGGAVEEKVVYFRVLLPNGVTLELQVCGPPREIPFQDFVNLVRREYQNPGRRVESLKPKRQIDWTSKDLHLIDAFENRITRMLDLRNFKANKSHMLRLCDGSAEADKYENMWDLTPDTDLLRELPEEYTFETALADLIDNSLQAVWSNHADQRRLISLELTKNRITIFDTGPGMNGSADNSIVKW